MLKNKVALITGSASGIGLGIARGLAQAGASIVLNGISDPDTVEELRSSLASETGVKVIYKKTDVSNPELVEQMVAEVTEELGSVDILVNNAGIQKVAPVEEFPVEKWDAIIAINLSSAFYLTRCVVPQMKEKNWGRIINISSAHGLVASPFKSAYVASKHGMLGFTKSIALEVAEEGITCNSICPGYVRTPLVEGQIKDTAEARGITEEEVIKDVMLGEQPTKKFVTVEELAAMTVFLCGEGGNSITGAALSVDGGWTAH